MQQRNQPVQYDQYVIAISDCGTLWDYLGSQCDGGIVYYIQPRDARKFSSPADAKVFWDAMVTQHKDLAVHAVIVGYNGTTENIYVVDDVVDLIDWGKIGDEKSRPSKAKTDPPYTRDVTVGNTVHVIGYNTVVG